jgi:DNA processing protein
MDLYACALVVLSAAGRDQSLLDDPIAHARALVGCDEIEDLARSLVTHWQSRGGRILWPDDPVRPAGLKSLGCAAPVLLWVHGELPVEPQESVAIVGSRNCTEYGRKVATELAAAAVADGRWVVSGGAKGIDAAAHRGALDARGKTVLYAAGGAGHVYPRENSEVFTRAARHGAVVWEYPHTAGLRREGFLHRNRLIAATSEATVVVEAAVRSGALNTGRLAADLGRLVLGVPGPIDSATSQGVHQGIADGWAALLLGTEDLHQLLGTQSSQQESECV